jgi:S-formylglutathione hydrolase FrmB
MKSWHKIVALISLLAIVFAFSGCSDRKNPTDVVYPSGNVYIQTLDSYALGHNPSLAGNLIGNPYDRHAFVYTPPGYDIADSSTKYPVLYFLHGFMDTTLAASTDFSYPYGLAETADRLIATGQIQPIIIAMVDCNSYLGSNIAGGSFYVNSPSPTSNLNQSLNGKFEKFYVDDFMYWVDTSFYVHKDKHYRAIAGHSMGGYGAFRIAMDYDTLFSVVGSLSGPLSFQYFADSVLIKHIFTANGIDSTTYKTLSYASTDELTRMFFAMAAAFSPHKITSTDDTSYFRVTRSGAEYGVDLPFDSAQNIRTSVWNNRWIDSNDVKTIYSRNPAKLDSMAVYIDYGDADEFGFDVQSREFYDQIVSNPTLRDYLRNPEYSGGGYIPAGNSTYLYYRIEELLKFVSKNFPQP